MPSFVAKWKHILFTAPSSNFDNLASTKTSYATCFRCPAILSIQQFKTLLDFLRISNKIELGRNVQKLVRHMRFAREMSFYVVFYVQTQNPINSIGSTAFGLNIFGICDMFVEIFRSDRFRLDWYDITLIVVWLDDRSPKSTSNFISIPPGVLKFPIHWCTTNVEMRDKNNRCVCNYRLQ